MGVKDLFQDVPMGLGHFWLAQDYWEPPDAESNPAL